MTFIPKNIYPAVMFARHLIRDGEPAGLAVYKSARYYQVCQSDVAAWLNGKKKKENKPSKYCWYIIFSSSDYDGEWGLREKGVELCNSRSNYKAKKCRYCNNLSRRCDTGSVYSPFFVSEVGPRVYNTKREAEAALEQRLQQARQEVEHEL